MALLPRRKAAHRARRQFSKFKFNAIWEVWSQATADQLTLGIVESQCAAVLIAQPEFLRIVLEVQRLFFLHFGAAIGRRSDLNHNFRGDGIRIGEPMLAQKSVADPCHIRHLDAERSLNAALDDGPACRSVFPQQISDQDL